MRLTQLLPPPRSHSRECGNLRLLCEGTFAEGTSRAMAGPLRGVHHDGSLNRDSGFRGNDPVGGVEMTVWLGGL